MLYFYNHKINQNHHLYQNIKSCIIEASIIKYAYYYCIFAILNIFLVTMIRMRATLKEKSATNCMMMWRAMEKRQLMRRYMLNRLLNPNLSFPMAL